MTRRVRLPAGWMTSVVVLLVLLGVFSQVAHAQKPGEVLQGTWTATSASRIAVQGGWSAQVHPETSNAVYGSWTVVGPGNRVLMQGTWSAEKSSTAWNGAWWSQTSAGREYSGTWSAGLETSGAVPMMEMLLRSAQERVAGSWRYGSLSGNWTITASLR